MKLYLKILQFLKPFWKLILVSIFLTFLYVLLNNISLWVSVDFIRELFNPKTMNTVSNIADSSQVAASQQQGGIDDLLNMKSNVSLYRKVNLAIKSFIIQDNRLDTLKVVCLVIFLSFFLKNMVAYIRRLINNFIELRIMVDLRNKLYDVLIRLPLSYFEKHKTGELTSIVFNDVQAVNVVLNNSFGKLILTPLQVLSNLAILLLISVKLSLITFVLLPVSGFLIIKIGQSIRRKSRRVFKQIANVVFVFQETISSVRIVKAFTNERQEEKRFQEANLRHFDRQYKANRLSYLSSPLNETLGALTLVVLLWFGGQMVYSGTGLMAEDFIRYLVFLFTMFQPLKDLSKLNNIIQTGLAATERIFNIIDTPQEVYDKPGARELSRFNDSIRFENVYFRYDETDKYVLEDINLDIKKGETVAFVGPSGAGKSTLVDLIPRFYDVTRGRVLIDNVDVRDFTLKSLRSHIGIVTQESILFNDTVRANISYGLENATDDQIIEAARVANAWEFIEKMENGLDTIIGERGIKLSGGQKQRLSIARAILKNPPILILDEATSALDSESEKLVQVAINNLMKNRTVLVIAHRLSTITHADKIVVLEKGKIVGLGTHRELLSDCPIYQKLYRLQFQEEKEIALEV